MVDITTLSFRQLQGELKKRGIKAKGKKAALQNLLQKDEDRLQSEESSTTAPSTKTTTKKAAAAPPTKTTKTTKTTKKKVAAAAKVTKTKAKAKTTKKKATAAVTTERPSKRARKSSSSTSSSTSTTSSSTSSSSSSNTTVGVPSGTTPALVNHYNGVSLGSGPVADNKKRGVRVSGRFWKLPQKRSSNRRSKTDQKRLWDKKEAGKQSYKIMKEVETDFLANREEERKARIEKLVAKRKRKAENEMKNSSFQQITNDNKIKRMTKNQLKLVKRMQVNAYTGIAELVSPWAGRQIRGKYRNTSR